MNTIYLSETGDEKLKLHLEDMANNIMAAIGSAGHESISDGDAAEQ